MLSESSATLFARLGLAARGLVYLLVGWFAVDAAFRGGAKADNQGAIASLADKPFGPVLLGVIAAGLAGYALWRLTEAATNPDRLEWDAKGALKRAGLAFSGVSHILLAASAAKLALDPRASAAAASPGDERARDWTAWLLAQPLGAYLVGLVAICFLFGAAQQAKKAWTADFAEELRGDAPAPAYLCTFGRIGYGARGVVFLILSGFFAVAAWRTRASEAGGMGDALGTLQAQPGGTWLLAATGLGLALFGVYGFVEARYRRIRF